MGIFQKGNNPGAYRGNLNCPVCRSSAVRFLENIGPYRQRYRCRKCGLPFQYDISYADPGLFGPHPYALFKKPKFQRVVEAHEAGRTINGGKK
jgi:predicted amidophosphoribosyltransferase